MKSRSRAQTPDSPGRADRVPAHGELFHADCGHLLRGKTRCRLPGRRLAGFRTVRDRHDDRCRDLARPRLPVSRAYGAKKSTSAPVFSRRLLPRRHLAIPMMIFFFSSVRAISSSSGSPPKSVPRPAHILRCFVQPSAVPAFHRLPPVSCRLPGPPGRF